MRLLTVLIAILATLITSVCFADKLMIPRDCFPKELQKQFLDKGYVVDLSGIERTKESWGFIENEGNQFNIYTYKSITDEELKDILEIINVEDNSK